MLPLWLLAALPSGCCDGASMQLGVMFISIIAASGPFVQLQGSCGNNRSAGGCAGKAPVGCFQPTCHDLPFGCCSARLHWFLHTCSLRQTRPAACRWDCLPSHPASWRALPMGGSSQHLQRSWRPLHSQSQKQQAVAVRQQRRQMGDRAGGVRPRPADVD